jgi:hypothetical protein
MFGESVLCGVLHDDRRRELPAHPPELVAALATRPRGVLVRVASRVIHAQVVTSQHDDAPSTECVEVRIERRLDQRRC